MAHMAPHRVVLHGHELSYLDSGSGPAVLFIHGILGSQRQWTHLVDKMDDDHRVLAHASEAALQVVSVVVGDDHHADLRHGSASCPTQA